MINIDQMLQACQPLRNLNNCQGCSTLKMDTDTDTASVSQSSKRAMQPHATLDNGRTSRYGYSWVYGLFLHEAA